MFLHSRCIPFHFEFGVASKLVRAIDRAMQMQRHADPILLPIFTVVHRTLPSIAISSALIASEQNSRHDASCLTRYVKRRLCHATSCQHII